MARRSPGPWFVPWVCLVLVLDLGKGQEEKPFGEMCLEDFTAGLPDWVLDTDASVQNGATFLSSPMVHRSRDCMRACCKDPACNLALVEQGPGSEEDHIQGCFLLNCLYEKAFVCRFARKIGFLNFLKKDVYDSYRAMQNHRPSDDHPPIARAVKDMRVQPGEPVMLRGTESTDDHGIVSYEWKQIHGNPSVEMKKHKEDQVEISNLQVGTYVFQLTVTDTAQQQDFTNITIMVLSSEQTEGDGACNNPICSACHCSLLGDTRGDETWGATEVAKQENVKGLADSGFAVKALRSQEHCLTPKKVGWCRGSFPRWFYNPSLQQCEEFIFGGCKPNKNNYLREEECELACKNVRGSVGGRQLPVCNGNCQAPFFRCKDGCCIDAYLECDETPDCADESDEMYCEQYAREFNRLQKINVTHKQGHCVDLPDTGQCTESIPRWYYNPFLEKCDPFTYGGCGGNSNNFEREEECMKSCSGVTKADVIGRRWESFESQTAMLSAFEVVIAVLLGISIMVVLVFIGYFFLKKRKKGSHRHQPPTATNSTLSTAEDTEHLFYSSTTKPV